MIQHITHWYHAAIVDAVSKCSCIDLGESGAEEILVDEFFRKMLWILDHHRLQKLPIPFNHPLISSQLFLHFWILSKAYSLRIPIATKFHIRKSSYIWIPKRLFAKYYLICHGQTKNKLLSHFILLNSESLWMIKNDFTQDWMPLSFSYWEYNLVGCEHEGLMVVDVSVQFYSE